MITYFYNGTKEDRIECLVNIAKQKIKKGELLLINDEYEILPKIESELIKNHYFYFTSKNLKFNLIQSMMKDGKLMEDEFEWFCKALFSDIKDVSIYNRVKNELKHQIEDSKNFQTIYDLYSFYIHHWKPIHSLSVNTYISNAFTKVFDKTSAKNLSENTSLLENLEDDKICIFTKAKILNEKDYLNHFLYLYLSLKINQENEKVHYVINNLEQISKDIVKSIVLENKEIYLSSSFILNYLDDSLTNTRFINVTTVKPWDTDEFDDINFEIEEKTESKPIGIKRKYRK